MHACPCALFVAGYMEFVRSMAGRACMPWRMACIHGRIARSLDCTLHDRWLLLKRRVWRARGSLAHSLAAASCAATHANISQAKFKAISQLGDHTCGGRESLIS